MIANIGCTDRTIRVIAGLALLSLFFLLEGNLRWLGLIGLVPLGTAALRFCPFYTALGVRTARN